MFIVGFDLGKRNSQVCVQDENGELLAELRIKTTRDDLTTTFAKFPKAQVLIEASTSSDWVARVLEGIGCDVVVGDPRFSLMYAQTNKKVKNDKRDARALADARRLKAFRRAHRKSDAARELSGRIRVRAQLLRMRTKLINLVRAQCEREGVIVPACESKAFDDVVQGIQMEAVLFEVVSPAVVQISSLTKQLDELDKELKAIASAHSVARLLQTVHGVGPLTALAFIAAVDDPKRFENARELTSYLGLVPGENNSGDSKRPPHAITKTGDSTARSYLVEAAFSHTNRRAPESHLKSWYAKLTKDKKSKKRAAVAVARRLARVLWAMWRDNKPFDNSRTAPFTPSPAKKPAAKQRSAKKPAQVKASEPA